MNAGRIKLRQNKTVFIGRAFAGEKVGLRQLTPDYWLVSFAALDLGYIHEKSAKFSTENPLTPQEDN